MSHPMKISDAASLGMHTMALLADSDEGPVTTHEMATLLDVSEAHLAKVMQRLVHAGLVRSERGPRGGFTLARAGSQISLLEVYETIEGPLSENTCLLKSRICGGSACIMGDLLQKMNRDFREYLAKTKLTDVTGAYKELLEKRTIHA